MAIIINGEIEIATLILDQPGNHPSILHLLTLTSHPKHFPDGIQESLIGVGNTFAEKAESAISNYLGSTFAPILSSLNGEHHPEHNLQTNTGGKEIPWHLTLGDLMVQGQWSHVPPEDYLYLSLKAKIHAQLTESTFNWVKLYISKMANGEITGECRINNKVWEEGTKALAEIAKTWVLHGRFQGLKQFMVFRRVDEETEGD